MALIHGLLSAVWLKAGLAFRLPSTAEAHGLRAIFSMAPHLTPDELDLLRHWSGHMRLTPAAVHKKLVQRRARSGTIAPNVTNVRKALRGLTYKAGATGKRGRKPKLTRAHVLKMNRTRVKLISDPKVGGQREVHWDEVVEKSGVPPVDRTTAMRAFAREGIDVQWRRPREKPQRTAEHVMERKDICSRWRFLSQDYFAKHADLVIDNKAWDYPATAKARTYLKRMKIRGHLRTKAEGLKPAFTKPNRKRHRMNPGGSLLVCAGLIHCRVKVWHYIDGRWNGQMAADVYRDILHPAMRRNRGHKQEYKVVEDNDPTGYKSKKAVDQKTECGITAMEFPRYSPDLNPWDFSLWDDIQRRMDTSAPAGNESRAAFKERLRRTAMATPTATVKKALMGMKKRIKAVYDAGGQDVDCD